MVNCKLCRVAKKLVKSHVLPKSLYGSTLGNASGSARIISSAPNNIPKRSHVGEYDKKLLCLECEESLSAYDKYAHDLFVKQEPDSKICDSGELLAYRYNDVKLEMLRIFFITLVWRMHATERKMFKSVRLGKYAEPFRVATLCKDSAAIPEFDVVLTKWDNKNMGLLGPTRLRLEGVNGYRITFPGYSIWAKIDRQSVPSYFDEIVLSTGEPLHMLASDFRDSAEFRAMLRLVRRQ